MDYKIAKSRLKAQSRRICLCNVMESFALPKDFFYKKFIQKKTCQNCPHEVCNHAYVKTDGAKIPASNFYILYLKENYY